IWRPMASQKPVRLCIGCRTRAKTNELVRIAYEIAGESRSLVIDDRSVLPGRGAWVHHDPEYLSKALQRASLTRAYRNQDETDNHAETLAKWQSENNNTPNNDESGSEN